MVSGDLKVVLSSGNLLLIERAKEALEDAGISYVVKGEGEHGMAMLGLWSSATIMAREIIVLAEDAELARQIIAGITEEEDEINQEET